MGSRATAAILALLLGLGSVPPVRAQEAPDLRDVVVSRSRLESRVTIEGILRNRAAADLTAVEVTFERIDPGAVVRPSDPYTRTSLAKGRSCRFALAIVRCPEFTAWRLRVRAKLDGKPRDWSWTAASPADPPVPEGGADHGARLVLVAKSLAPDERTHTAMLVCKVRNEGDSPSRMAAVRFQIAGRGVPEAERTAILGTGRLNAGEEAEYRVPAMAPADAKVIAAEVLDLKGSELPIGGGDFSGDPTVEAAGFRFEKLDDGRLLVSGSLRNGLDHAVHAIVVAVTLEAKGGDAGKIEARIAGPVYPGEIFPFGGVLEAAPAFESFRYDLGLAHDQDLKTRPPDPDLDPGAASSPETAEEPHAPAPVVPAGKSPAKKVGIAGIKTLEGEWTGAGKSMTYSGDLILLKLRFYDADGKPVVQPGTLEVLFTSGGAAKGKAEQPLTENVWKLDYRKLAKKQIGDRTVAFDAATGDLYAAIYRWKEDVKFALAMDVRFTSKEGEKWTFRRLDEPYEAEPQAMDAGK